jgi:glycosyltransferase involved in cell wall biosynthesis
MQMHILFLTDNFPPEVNAPASRTHEHCREWVAAGHKVTVITCAPNFPGGRVFDGYRNSWRQQESIDGIEVIRVWTYIAANAGFGRRVLDYLSFMVTAFMCGLSVRRPDVIVGTSPQFFTVCAAWALAAMKRRPFVFELRDLWPDSIKAVGAMRQSFAIRLLEKLELFLYRRSALIVSVTHSFKRILGERGIDTRKIEVVTNGVDMTRFSRRPKNAELMRKLGLEGKFVGGYIGTHGMAHGLDTLLEAARRLAAGDAADKFRIVLLGDGAEKARLRAEAERLQLRNVVFVDTVPKNLVADYWALLDVSIIHLRKTELFGSVIPSKLFECLGMGVPVLHGVAGESADIVRREHAGWVFEPENVDQLVAGLEQLQANPDELTRFADNCAKAAQNYDRSVLAARMLAALSSVAN